MNIISTLTLTLVLSFKINFILLIKIRVEKCIKLIFRNKEKRKINVEIIFYVLRIILVKN